MDDWELRLSIRGRFKLSNHEFLPSDLLYRGYSFLDLDESGRLSVESFESSDLSCSWGRFSLPEDIRHAHLHPSKSGCYSLTVDAARYRQLATPCHDPIEMPGFENYSHVEIRWLKEDEDVFFEPPKGRSNSKSKIAKADRLAWRQNCVLKAKLETAPRAG